MRLNADASAMQDQTFKHVTFEIIKYFASPVKAKREPRKRSSFSCVHDGILRGLLI